MGPTTISTTNSTIVAAFKTALLHQFLIVIVLLALLVLAWNGLRAVELRRGLRLSREGKSATEQGRSELAEPVARRVLRIVFGFIWIIDGVLQAQPAMPIGMPSQVLTPAAAASPGWVGHVVAFGTTIWQNHPVVAAASVVWIQIGLGLFLLVAPRGEWSRIAGASTVGWSLVVWVFGEAFGGIFAPGASVLFGAPGGVLCYALAGALVCLPESSWQTARLGRRLLASFGVFFLAMAVLQAWPGRGFWNGLEPHSSARGTLGAMVANMATTPQPSPIAAAVRAFGDFDATHGLAINFAIVIVLVALGLGLVVGGNRALRFALAGSIVFCLADWLLVQDFGVFGGVGTDPNSMIPILALLVVGFLAVTRPGGVIEPGAPVVHLRARGRSTWPGRFVANPTYTFRVLAGIAAIGVTVLGIAPIAEASLDPHADAIVSQSIDGTAQLTDAAAPPFHLVDQRGDPVSLSTLRGKTLALTFLDPVCTNDCPVIAQEFHQADDLLGTSARDVEMIAVVANPLYRSQPVLADFDRSEGLDAMKNWLFLSGSVDELESVWEAYGIEVNVEPGGAMIAHSDVVYVIDARGHEREILDADTGPATSTTQSSFAGVLSAALEATAANP